MIRLRSPRTPITAGYWPSKYRLAGFLGYNEVSISKTEGQACQKISFCYQMARVNAVE